MPDSPPPQMTQYRLKIRGGSTLKRDGEPAGETSSQIGNDVSFPVWVQPEHEWLMDHLLRVWNQAAAIRETDNKA